MEGEQTIFSSKNMSENSGRNTIYIRKTNKEAIRLKVKLPLLIKSLKQSIIKKFQMTSKELALFYHGSRIDQK